MEKETGLSFEMRQINSTLEHIREVQELLNKCSIELVNRGIWHDATKFSPEEWPYFLANTEKLSCLTYDSPEYKESLKEMRPAIENHYKSNRHHPEHFVYRECNGCFARYLDEIHVCKVCGYSQFTDRPNMSQMTLIDLIEMFCDWIAATKRQKDGDIIRSIELNQKRFGYSDELKAIFQKTVQDGDWLDG